MREFKHVTTFAIIQFITKGKGSKKFFLKKKELCPPLLKPSGNFGNLTSSAGSRKIKIPLSIFECPIEQKEILKGRTLLYKEWKNGDIDEPKDFINSCFDLDQIFFRDKGMETEHLETSFIVQFDMRNPFGVVFVVSFS